MVNLSQSGVVMALFWVLLVSALLSVKPWRKEFHASNDPGDQLAFRVIEVLFALVLVIFTTSLILACLFATIWTFPGAAQPAPTWTYLPLAADLLIIVSAGWAMARRFIRRRSAAGER